MCIKMICEILNDSGLHEKVSMASTISNALHCTRHFTQHSQFLSTKTNFLALQITHFQAELRGKFVINVR